MIDYKIDSTLIGYRLFDPFPGVRAFTTTRNTIKANAAPRFTGSVEAVVNRKLLLKIGGISSESMVFPQQTHTSSVVRICSLPEAEPAETDALITNLPNICLCIQTADCVPILLYDPKMNAIAAVHAGWRGTVNHIAMKTVKKMSASFHSSPADILVVIGPSISPEVYEVGYPVIDVALKNIPEAEKTIFKNTSGKYCFSLWEANRRILLSSGLQSGNVEVFGECTFSLAEKYFSARREGVETGRLVSGIMMSERSSF